MVSMFAPHIDFRTIKQLMCTNPFYTVDILPTCGNSASAAASGSLHNFCRDIPLRSFSNSKPSGQEPDDLTARPSTPLCNSNNFKTKLKRIFF